MPLAAKAAARRIPDRATMRGVYGSLVHAATSIIKGCVRLGQAPQEFLSKFQEGGEPDPLNRASRRDTNLILATRVVAQAGNGPDPRS